MPLNISAHASVPLLAIGLTEGGVTVAPVSDVCLPTFASKCSVTHAFPKACHATELQSTSCNPHIYASTESVIHIFDTTTSNPLHTYDLTSVDKDDAASAVTATVLKCIDESTLLAGDDNGGIHLFDTRSPRKQRASVLQQADYISSLTHVDMYGTNAVLSTSGDGTLCAYDIRSGRIKLQYATDGMNDDLLSLAVLKDDGLAVAGTLSGALNIYNLRFLDEHADADAVAHIDRMHGHPECVNAVLGCEGEGGVVVTASSDGFVRVVDIVNKQLVGVLDYEACVGDDDDDEVGESEGEEDVGSSDDESAEERGRKQTEQARQQQEAQKRKRVQRWPIEGMVSVKGLGSPLFALVAHDRLVRFCDGAPLIEDEDDKLDEEKKAGSATMTRVAEAEFTKQSKGRKKKRRNGGNNGPQSRDGSNGFFGDL